MRTGITCVVPARLGSTRFFGKLLTPIFGKPLIVHTLERALGAGCFDRVVCLTDSVGIGEAAAAHGFEWVLSGDAANGTERIARALDVLDSDLIVNLQGDEPAFPEEGLRTLAAALAREPGSVHLLVHAEAATAEDIANPNRVKTVVDENGLVTGFFRTAPPPGWSAPMHAPAPGAGAYRCAPTVATLRLQLGAYAYHRDTLAAYAALPPSAEEIALSHEMLRAFDLAPIRAHILTSTHHGASVDVPEDLVLARNALEALTRRAPGPAQPPEIFSHQELQNRLQGAPA